jgi:DNA invertase Pin-like site-specific DNA recombinase
MVQSQTLMSHISTVDSQNGALVGYARVSTEEQKLDLQIDALQQAGCDPIYQEQVSAAAKRRHQLDLAIKGLNPGDTLVVWRLDRLARSMRELYGRLHDISEAGASFRSLSERFDFSTATGKVILGFFGLMAEFERQLTIERTKAGLAAARERGQRIGAHLKFNEVKRAKAKAMLKETRIVTRGGKRLTRPKHSRRAIAKKMGVSYQTLYDWIKRGYK